MNPVGRTLITTFGLGYMRPASGTWGSLPPCVAAAVLVVIGGRFGFGSGSIGWYVLQVFFALYFSWVCVKFGDGAEAEFGKKDPGQVVADETAGMALTLLFIPFAWIPPDPVSILVVLGVAFILFRVADILKLPPANGLQRLKGGWGILVDDLAAGVQAGVVLLGLCWLWHTQNRVI